MHNLFLWSVTVPFFRILLFILIPILLSSCLAVLPNKYNPIVTYHKAAELYEQEASFNDDIVMPTMVLNGVQLVNERYIKDPLYKPKGGDFQYRINELEKLTSSTRNVGNLYSSISNMIYNETEKFIATDTKIQNAISSTKNDLKDFEEEAVSIQKAKLLVSEHLSLLDKKASKIHQDNYENYARKDQQLTKKWNQLLKKLFLESPRKEQYQYIRSYREKIYLIHKLFINNALSLAVNDNRPNVTINNEAFLKYISLIGKNDLVRFSNAFNWNGKNPSQLAKKVESDFNKKLHNNKHWGVLIRETIKPSNISTYDFSDEHRELSRNNLLIINTLISQYINKSKNVYILSGTSKPPFTSSAFGNLYINENLLSSMKDAEVLDAVLLHEAIHIRHKLIKGNPHTLKLERLNANARKNLTTFFGTFGRLGNSSKSEIDERVNEFTKKISEGTKKGIDELKKYEEYVVDSEVFARMNSNKSEKFIDFMQDTHVSKNRYKVDRHRENSCFDEYNYISRTYSNYNGIYTAFFEKTPFDLKGDNECLIIKRLINWYI